MSSVIPNDRTGLVKHPTKMDCWVPGETNSGDNLCLEIPIGETMECTLGKPDLTTLTDVHLTQIQMELWNNRGGGPEGKIINSFYSGATPNQRLSSKEVVDFTDKMVWFYGDAKKASDVIDNYRWPKTDNLIVGNEMKSSLHPDDPMQNEEVIPNSRDYMRRHVADELISHYEMPPPKDTMTVYNEVCLDWKVQIYNWVVRQYGGKPSSYLLGETKDTLLPAMAVEEFAKVVISEYDNDPRLAADVLKAALTEHIALMSAMAMQHSMKEKGLMPALTKVVDNMIEQVNTKGEENEALKQLIEAPSGEKGPKGPPAVVNSVRKPKRKKSKAKSNHLPNMKAGKVKSALGAAILGMLGKVQRDTQDTQKRALLKALPAADVIEMVTGEKLPDYQANLINKFQAEADPEAPIVARIKEDQGKTREEVLTELQEECIAVQDQVTTLEKKSFETLLDEALKAYLIPELFPYGAEPELVAEAVEKTRQFFLSRQDEITAQAVGFQLMDDLDAVGVKPPFDETSLRLIRGENGSKRYRLTLDEHDPQPGSTISHVLAEIGVASPVEVILNDLTVETIGGNIKDLRITYGENSEFYHYERFTEEAADELKSTIEYVQERIADPKFYEGLVNAIVESVEPKLAEWLAAFGEEQMWVLVNKLIVGYTVGYVQGIADSQHKLASQAVDAAPADLG